MKRKLNEQEQSCVNLGLGTLQGSLMAPVVLASLDCEEGRLSGTILTATFSAHQTQRAIYKPVFFFSFQLYKNKNEISLFKYVSWKVI